MYRIGYMLSNIWNTALYEPLLNALAFLVSIMPGGSVGLAVIVLTLIVKIVLFPIAKKSIESQAKMNVLAPEIKKIKEGGKSKEEQAKETFELYKKNKTNPFSGCLLLIIQIPIIIALYSVFLKGLSFNSETLYSFIQIPDIVDMNFLGLLDLSKKSIVLAILAGVSQFFQARFMPKQNTASMPKGGFQESFAKSMQVQMKYVFPFIVFFISFTVTGAIALYFVISNIFAIGQQAYLNKKMGINQNNDK